ncbi:MAG TPA: DUF1934 domain-containing protein [Candidatus Fusicatenibacter merdavium]|uniref:DUF1934 domain-containing protein n=1 Tax=Candidatus Fusicatenibacter merdavium TaxID=2838600 RepID=A0A9D1XGY0_9FIRM|nr:DUF1934 domain-containing protein [Candidatus Fusicatenibacter merdavium]
MTKDVIISIRGLQVLVDENGEQEPVEVLNAGQYYYKNNQHYILYDEPAEGFEETTHNILKFNKNKLEVRKRGLMEVHMIFEENKKNISMYQTPFGVMDMGIATTRIELTEEPERIFLEVDYALEMGGSYVGDCNIQLLVQARTKENLAL